jgi:hypothetical protein
MESIEMLGQWTEPVMMEIVCAIHVHLQWLVGLHFVVSQFHASTPLVGPNLFYMARLVLREC